MRIIRYNENILDECAEFWWGLYGKRPYVVRPDGYEHPNAPSVGPGMFRKQLGEVLSGRSIARWSGEVSPDSIIIAKDEGKIAGLLFCSVSRDELVGNINSAFMDRDQRGQDIADLLLNEAIEHFRKLGLRKAMVGPTGGLEVECPIHVAALESGFAWEGNWEQTIEETGEAMVYSEPGYGVVMGGPLEGFQLQPEMEEKIDTLRKQGIKIESITIDELQNLRRFDTRETLDNIHPNYAGVTLAALVDGFLVGWFGGTPCRETPEVMARAEGLYVIPDYRRRGIGKVLYHLATEKMVQQGAQYGFIRVGIHSPFRMIIHSVGYRYWYLCFGWMSKYL